MSKIQTSVALWMDDCFGRVVADDTGERSYRFMEECLELVQAGGMSKEQVLQMVDYTFDRPAGALCQEVGGVVLTLAALCQAHGLDMLGCGEMEISRVWQPEVMEKIRKKQATKPHGSPLPGVSDGVPLQAARVTEKGLVLPEGDYVVGPGGEKITSDGKTPVASTVIHKRLCKKCTRLSTEPSGFKCHHCGAPWPADEGPECAWCGTRKVRKLGVGSLHCLRCEEEGASRG